MAVILDFFFSLGPFCESLGNKRPSPWKYALTIHSQFLHTTLGASGASSAVHGPLWGSGIRLYSKLVRKWLRWRMGQIRD